MHCLCVGVGGAIEGWACKLWRPVCKSAAQMQHRSGYTASIEPGNTIARVALRPDWAPAQPPCMAAHRCMQGAPINPARTRNSSMQLPANHSRMRPAAGKLSSRRAHGSTPRSVTGAACSSRRPANASAAAAPQQLAGPAARGGAPSVVRRTRTCAAAVSAATAEAPTVTAPAAPAAYNIPRGETAGAVMVVEGVTVQAGEAWVTAYMRVKGVYHPPGSQNLDTIHSLSYYAHGSGCQLGCKVSNQSQNTACCIRF